MQKSIHYDDYQHFLTALRRVRNDAGVSQEQLAAALGEHQTFVSKVERGGRRLDVVDLRWRVKSLDIAAPTFCERLDARLSRHHRPTGPVRLRQAWAQSEPFVLVWAQEVERRENGAAWTSAED